MKAIFKRECWMAVSKLLLLGTFPLVALACQDVPLRGDTGKSVGKENREMPPRGVPEEDTIARIDYVNGDPKEAARAVFRVMDSFGPTAREDSERAMSAFLSREDAFTTLRSIYEGSVDGKYSKLDGWKSVFLIGEIYTENSVAFLGQVILEDDPTGTNVPLKSFPGTSIHDENKEGHSVEYAIDIDFNIKLTAASAVARASEKSLRTPVTVIKEVMRKGDSDIARELAVDLFSRDKLSVDLKQILSSREIFSDFRRATTEEKKQLFEIDLDELKIPDGKPVDMTDPIPFPN